VDATKQLDLDYLLDMSGGDYEFVSEVLATFVESTPSLITDLQNALFQGNAAGAMHAAHTLKGSSRSIGAEPFALLCQEVEHAARKEDTISCISAARELPNAYQLLLNEIGRAMHQKAA
jgi:two-component system, sensor histidine kinase and response regulator